MNSTFANIRSVLKERKYFLIFAFTSFFVFVSLSLLTLATTTNFSPEIFMMMNGKQYAFFTLLLFTGISLLSGLYFSLIVYKILAVLPLRKKASSFTGSGAFLLGIFSTGCPMCGAFILGLFGFPLALFFMPFKGLELRFLSFLLLLITVYLMSKELIHCQNWQKSL